MLVFSPLTKAKNSLSLEHSFSRLFDMILNEVQINNAIVEVSQLQRSEQKGLAEPHALLAPALTHCATFWLSLAGLNYHSSELVTP